MSDNAFAYTKGPKFAGVLAELGARHIPIAPYAPRWNGKLERFFGTLKTNGARPRMAQLGYPRPRALLIHSILQPLPTSQRRQRPSTHHPRPLSPQAEQLIWPEVCQVAAPKAPHLRGFLVGVGGGGLRAERDARSH